ncbi:MAG: PBP1A family penicillin-binding protein [Leptospiraceae bacterium]|nr:PBP1A family penicillin-binding protein [Leptospiraceae bacterium]
MKQNESPNLLSRLIITKFRDTLTFFGCKENDFGKLVAIASILCFLNILLIVASPTDFFKIQKANDYERPSILYGINSKNEYEPIAEFYKFSRVVVPIHSLKPESSGKDKRHNLIQCFLSTEDNNFYSHTGVDFRGIFRAFAVNLIAGKIREGASTITQQVTRIKFLSIERSFLRKAREVWLAFLMEMVYDKDTIMEMYLNEIPLGHGTLGAGAAARFYFRKDLNDLTWGEAALLSSLTTRPKEFSPLVNPIVSNNKVRIVFMKLIETGKMDIQTAEEEYSKFADYYMTLNRSPNDSAFSDRLNRFPYFTEYVRKNLNKTINTNKLYSGGFKIYSTLNIRHQTEAEKALQAGLTRQTEMSNQRSFKNVEIFDKEYGQAYDIISNLFDLSDFKFKISRMERTFRSSYQEDYRDNLAMLNLLTGSENVGEIIDFNFIKQNTQDHLLPVEGGIISMRPDTGYITALVGGSGFRSDNQQIRPVQAYRQPGSSFKPLVYAATMDNYFQNPDPKKNVTAATIFLDSPIQYLMDDGDEWTPENYSDEYSGFTRLRSALESSKNSVAVRVVEHVGLSKIMPSLKAMLQLDGGREIPHNYSVSLGAFEVTPYELTRAYAAFASKGKEVFPISVLYITDDKGKVIQDFRIEHNKRTRKQIISPEVSFIMTSMMEDVIRKGTGKSALSYGLRRPAAGKTGTTNNFRDAWFVGYTPELVSSVWLGFDTGTISLGRGMSGGVVAAPIWGRFMQNALLGESTKQFDFGDINVITKKVCAISGKLPGVQCTKTIDEYFVKGTIPTEICQDHLGVAVEPVEEKKSKPIPLTLPKKKKYKNLFQGDDQLE